MCGIIGYCGINKARNILIDGLYSLEYRGYDSAGVSFLKNNDFLTFKSVGRVLNLDKTCPKDIDSFCGIGHTRWATHGVPSEENAHPHVSSLCTVVHNGIIENYLDLKNELISLGYRFKSDTDSECIAHLADFYFKKTSNPLDVIIEVRKRLIGSYAFAIMFKESKKAIWACKKDNPLVISKSDDGTYISSDLNVLLKYSTSIYVPSDDDIMCIDENLYIFNSEKEEKEFKFEEYIAQTDVTDKGDFPHYMIKEICEQPSIIYNLCGSMLDNNGLPDFSKTGISDAVLENFDSINIVACGSAMHAGIVGRYWIEKMACVPVVVTTASEYVFNPQIPIGNTLFIAISQSGETADTISALRLAKKRGLKTLGIVNKEDSVISRESDYVIYTKAGPEIAVATTKGYTSQLVILYLLAAKLSILKDESKLFEVKNRCDLLRNVVPGQIEELISKRDKVVGIVKRIFGKDDIYYIGRGLDYNVCIEASLKLKEISYIHCEAYAAGELKHGTLSLIEKGTPVIAFCTDESLCKKMISNVKEVMARGGYTVLVGCDFIKKFKGCCDDMIVLPTVNETLMPFVSSVVSQIIAYETALLRGCDIDHPRNLAKSVTVE